jgi:polysaccharide pyruvyl transferase WcaK-like protein
MKVVLFGHFGAGNWGNESTFLTAVSYLRTRYPGSELTCVTGWPDVAAERYGLKAVPITTRAARIWNRDVPLIRRVSMALGEIAAELRQYLRAFTILRGADVFVVPGTGLVNDAYGLSDWGPYSLFKWILTARLRRARVLVVSVGAGPLYSAPGRILAKAALSLADYRSYRDKASMEYLKGIGFESERDHIYPDLVFGLPGELLPAGRAENGGRPVVGIGLMEYAGRYAASDPRPETYRSYLESLAVLAEWLLRHDYDIRLLLGDADTVAIDEFRSILEARGNGYDGGRIIERPIASVHDILAEIAATDLVVATRFHNILLSMVLNKPVIAISFHHKCSELMKEMNMAEYCHDIHNMDAGSLIEQFRRLAENQEAIKRAIGDGVDAARAAVSEQYDLIFATS